VLGKKHALPIFIAVDPGGTVRELVSREAAHQLLVQKGVPGAAEQLDARNENAKREKKSKQPKRVNPEERAAVLKAVVAELVGLVAQKQVSDIRLWRFLVVLLIQSALDVVETAGWLLERIGISEEEAYDGGWKVANTMTEAQARAAVFEIALLSVSNSNYYAFIRGDGQDKDGSVTDACGLFGVDLKRIEADIKAQLASTPTDAPPAKKGKGKKASKAKAKSVPKKKPATKKKPKGKK